MLTFKNSSVKSYNPKQFCNAIQAGRTANNLKPKQRMSINFSLNKKNKNMSVARNADMDNFSGTFSIGITCE